MRLIVDFCKQSTTTFREQQQSLDKELNDNRNKTRYHEIKTALNKNQEVRTRELQRNKDRKYIHLKFNTNQGTQRKHRRQNNDGEEQHQPRQTNNKPNYANATRNSRSKTQVNNKRSNTQVNRKNSKQQINKPNQTKSQTKEQSTQQRINQLEQQIQNLKESQQNNNNQNSKETPNEPTQAKNEEAASVRNGGEMIQIHEVLDYISTAMQTLSAFEERFKIQLNTNKTRTGM